MFHKITPVLTLSAAAALLSGCVSHAVVNPNFSMPKTGKSAVMALSVVCKTTRHSTASEVFGLEPFDSTANFKYKQTNASYWTEQEGKINLRCDGRTHHYLEHVKAGNYRFDEFNLSNGTVDPKIRFSLPADKVTYIGRITVDARAVTQDGGSDYVTFIISNHARSDLAYFKHHFKNITAREYRVQLAHNAK